MEIIITGLHLEITDAIRNYANEKIGKISKYNDGINTVRLTLEVKKNKQKDLHIAKALVYVNSKEIVVEEDGEDLYTAIDKLSDKLERQVRKQKEKMQIK